MTDPLDLDLNGSNQPTHGFERHASRSRTAIAVEIAAP